ncbi:hypothetical protein I79_010004 [Cricetulus griseus]|uniref:Uncharacterized protein n=1 Tax=Cricetulus griseus TaxID=10029 RepID=G3HHA6_CRIGR|nr:hypothetical protein I79_010004 [Cricetulus griseus]
MSLYLSHTLDELQHISGRGCSQSVGFRLCGELAGGHLPGKKPRKSASGVPTEPWQERQQGVSRPFALESCREPEHTLTRTSRDPRLLWGTVSRQEAGTSEKGICQSEANNPYSPSQSMAIYQDTGTGQGQPHDTWCSCCPYWLTESGCQ